MSEKIDKEAYGEISRIAKDKYFNLSQDKRMEHLEVVRNLLVGKRIRATDKHNGYTVEGTIKTIDRENHLLIIESPNGVQKVIIILDYIITIIPMIEVIIDSIVRLVKKLRFWK